MGLIHNYIQGIVNREQGIKAVELAVMVQKIFSRNGIQLNPLKLIGELVEQGEIIEVEYILPNLDYKVKSMYFPKGTRIRSK